MKTFRLTGAAVLAAAGSVVCASAGEPTGSDAAAGTLTIRQVGDTFNLGPNKVIVREYDVTRVVRNQYSDRFRFDCYADKQLGRLRVQEKLEEVIARGKTEFDRQVLLLDWTYRRFLLFGPPGARVGGALEILAAVDEGKSFNCGYYARVLKEAASSLGWPVRSIGLKGAQSDGNGSEHSILEIWSNQYRKWIVLDPTLNIYFEMDGVPLNAHEIRQAWFYNQGHDLVIVIGAERERHGVGDLPIVRAYHRGFGNLGINDRSLGKFLYIAYLPTTSSGGPDYTNMFITRDKLCEGVPYHTRQCPEDPAREPYWPMCQADLTFSRSRGLGLKVSVDTMTPDFAGYRWRIDGGEWRQGTPSEWTLHPGTNSLEVMAVNKFGQEGLPSKVVLEAG